MNICFDNTIFNGRSVLIIEDDDMLRDFMESCMMEFGFNSRTATDGRKAVEIFSSSPEPFDLVILDLVMPGLSGAAVYKMLQEIRPGQKVIITTGNVFDTDIDELKSAGISGMLRKPCKIEELFNTIQEALK